MPTVTAAAAGETVSVEYGRTPPVLYGSSIGGYWSSLTPGETHRDALPRITSGFVAAPSGHLPIVRIFTASDLALVDPASTVFLDAQPTQALIEKLAARQTISYLSTNHEPEKGTMTPQQWGATQVAAAATCAKWGNGRVRYVPVLMGGSMIPGRPNPSKAGYTLDQWLSFDKSNCFALGGDMYQWGKNDAGADSADKIGSALTGTAVKYGFEHAIFAELGGRRVDPPYSPGISDAARATFLTGMVAFGDKHAGFVIAMCYFESDNGEPDMKPWVLLAPKGKPAISPLAAAVWRAACSR